MALPTAAKAALKSADEPPGRLGYIADSLRKQQLYRYQKHKNYAADSQAQDACVGLSLRSGPLPPELLSTAAYVAGTVQSRSLLLLPLVYAQIQVNYAGDGKRGGRDG